MDGKEGLDVPGGCRFQRGGDGRGREVIGEGVDVGKERGGSATEDGGGGGEEREWGGNDCIAGADTGGFHSEPKGVRAAGTADAEGRATGFGGGGLKAGDRRAEDEALGVADSFDGGEEFGAQGGVLTGEVQHGNGRWGVSKGARGGENGGHRAILRRSPRDGSEDVRGEV